MQKAQTDEATNFSKQSIRQRLHHTGSKMLSAAATPKRKLLLPSFTIALLLSATLLACGSEVTQQPTNDQTQAATQQVNESDSTSPSTADSATTQTQSTTTSKNEPNAEETPAPAGNSTDSNSTPKDEPTDVPKQTPSGPDAEVLIALYQATDGDNWNIKDNWMTNNPINTWHGVYVDKTTGRVRELRLPNNGLAGPLPPELAGLKHLDILDLSDNQLSGQVQHVFGKFDHKNLVLSRNPELCLPVPDRRLTMMLGAGGSNGIASCADTGSADADRAALEAFYQATDGDNWKSNENWMSDQPLETWFGIKINHIGRVSVLNLPRNQLNGNIPKELSNLPHLGWLILADNQLTGEIPPELGDLVYINTLALNNNQLTGEIPSTIGNMVSMEHIRLHDNQLTGEIPPSLERMRHPSSILLSKNQLEGNIPAWLGNLKPDGSGKYHGLEKLDLSQNRLTGEIPPQLGQLSGAREINLSDNQLTGNIPQELNGLNATTVIYRNSLSGCTPTSTYGIIKADLEPCP